MGQRWKKYYFGVGRLSVLAIVLGVWWMLGAATVVQGQCAPCEWVSFKHDATGVEWQEWRCSECGGSGKTGSASGGPPKPGVAVEVEPPGASPFSPYRPGGSSGKVAVLRLPRDRELLERVHGCNAPEGTWFGVPFVGPYKPGPDAAHPSRIQISLEGGWRANPDLSYSLDKFEVFSAQFFERPGSYKKFDDLRTYRKLIGKEPPAYELKLIDNPADLDNRYLTVHFKLLSEAEVVAAQKKYSGKTGEAAAVVTDYVVRDIVDGKRISVSYKDAALGTYSSARYELIETTVNFNRDQVNMLLEAFKEFYQLERQHSGFVAFERLARMFIHEALTHSTLGYYDQSDSVGDPEYLSTNGGERSQGPGRCFASYVRRATEYARTGKWPSW